MVCTTSCTIAAMFIIATVVFNISIQYSGVAEKYKASLTPEQSKVYKQVVELRTNISNQGYFTGVCVGVVLALYANSKTKKMSKVSSACIVLSSAFIVNYFYYMLSPKPIHMLDVLSTKQEIAAWKNMYRSMQFNYHLSLVIGLIGAGVLGFGLGCN